MSKDIQIILQVETRTGSFNCEGFTDFPIITPCVIVIATAGTNLALKWADQLHTALTRMLTTLGPVHAPTQAVPVPCNGAIAYPFICHAHRISSATKLLVLVGDPSVPFPKARLFEDWLRRDSTYRVLPVFQTGSNVATLMTNTAFATQNAVFWRSSIEESAFSILATAGLTATEHRLFISYYRPDTDELAEQLFDALSHAHFDVYLDRFRTPPGMDFALRIEQELADKATILVLESHNLGKSRWCRHEIVTAQRWRLGLIGLRMPDGIFHPGVTSRISLGRSDFRTPAYKTLSDAAVETVLSRIKLEHDRKLIYRRWCIRRSFEAQLRLQGVRISNYDNDGLVHCASRDSLSRYGVWLPSSTLEVTDFQRTERALDPLESGVMIGLSVAEANRRDTLEWLSKKSSIHFRDEGELVSVAKQIAEGKL